MRRWQDAVLLVAVVLVWATASEAQPLLHYNGQELLDDCTAVIDATDAQQHDTATMLRVGHCTGYIEGVMAGLTYATERGPAFRFCAQAPGLSEAQLARLVVQWLRTHPAWLGQPKDLAATVALRQVLPCPDEAAPPSAPPPSMPSGSKRRR